MTRGQIRRDPEAASRRSYDLIVVGGGAYGIMVALEATRRRLRPLLVERGDFGAATSYNSLRILHGGLRYLQSLDVARCLESIRERAWWRRHFPELVEPLPCLLALDGIGARRPAVLRLALGLNHGLERLRGVDGSAVPRGGLLGPSALRRVAPALADHGLRGGAVWYDGFAPDAPRLLIEVLRWACAQGAVALNYVAAKALIEKAGRVGGIRARDVETGTVHEFRADLVINAAGPWARRVAAACGAAEPRVGAPVLAWNVAFRRSPPSDHALGVRPPRGGARTYFLVPWKGALLAGTGYAAWSDDTPPDALPEALLADFVDDLNTAVPGLALTGDEVIRAFPGVLPAGRAGETTPAERPVIVDHRDHGGPPGLFSVSGVKLTTARAVADRVLRRALPAARPTSLKDFGRPPVHAREAAPDHALAWRPAPGDEAWHTPLRAAIEDEAALHLDDLLLRRSGLGDDPERAIELAPAVCSLFGWSATQANVEQERLRKLLAPVMPAPRRPSPEPAHAGVAPGGIRSQKPASA